MNNQMREQIDRVKNWKQFLNENYGLSKIYFAHPINTYNKPIEYEMIYEIEKAFPTKFILNPNNPSIESLYKIQGMDVFKKLVGECDSLICLPFDDGTIGAGKAKEITWALRGNKPCYYIVSTNPFMYEPLTNLEDYQVLSVDETREKLKSE